MPRNNPAPKALACELPPELIAHGVKKLILSLLDTYPIKFEYRVADIRSDSEHLRSFTDAVLQLALCPLEQSRDSLLIPTANGNVFKTPLPKSSLDEVPEFLRASSQVHSRESEAVA